MAEYALTFTPGYVRQGDLYIPVVDGSPNYEAFKEWVASGGVPDPYITPVPAAISDRQFFQQLAIDGIITEDQALAANAAVIPAPLLSIIDQMPEGERFGVKMLVSGATTFERDNPVTIAIGKAYGMSQADIDTFFTAAAAL